MGWFTKLRDAVESAAVIGGNYFVPGSSMLTSQLVSEGSQKQLNSDLGRVAQLGSGLTGAGVGSEYTGIPASGGYSTLSNMFGGGNAATPEVAKGLEVGAGGAGVTEATTAANELGNADKAAIYGNTGYGAGMPSEVVSQGTNMPVGNADKAAMYGSEGYGPIASPAELNNTQGSPSFLNSMMSGNFGAAAGAAGDWAAKNPVSAIYGAGSLYDMFAKNQMAAKQNAMYQQNRQDILNTYAPGSPEYNLLKQEMDRKDAAAGRNSQYGTRANEFAGKIAGLRMNALGNMQSGQNALGNQALGNQFGMFNTPLTLAALTATSK